MSRGPEGRIYDVAFRCLQHDDCKAAVLWTDADGRPHTCMKYDFIPKMEKRLHNVHAIVHAKGGAIEITEGQLDADALAACGLWAVGVPGASGWKAHHRRLFEGFERVRVWGDGDTAGKDFATAVAAELRTAEIVRLPPGGDVCDMLRSGGKEAVLAIAEGKEPVLNDPVPPAETIPF